MSPFSLRSFLLVIFFLVPFAALAQNQNQPPDTQGATPAELDALVAPIALYPDTLVAQLLMASTYPLEIVQAERWATEHKNLKAEDLKKEVDKQGWDDSVKALVATPSVLTIMSSKLDWTQKLGDAVLAQQPDLMDAIQRLRSKAQANNKLSSTKEQKVTVTQDQGRQVISVEPTTPDTIHVPYYDPGVVYGEWPDPSYPPYYFPPPGYIPGAILGTGIAFGAGYLLGNWASGGNYWGGGMNWNNNNININRSAQINPLSGGNAWQHNPTHRQGVKYNNSRVQQKFGNNNIRGGSQARADFRGRGGDQVLKPGGGASNVANRGPANAQNRPPAKAQNRARAPAKSQTANRAKGGSAAARPSQRASIPARGNAFNVQSGRTANLQSQRGQASFASRGGARASMGGGGMRGGGGGGGGGGMRGGGGGGGGRGGGGGGGGRRSDISLKHDITLIGRLDNGLGYYSFVYNGGHKVYVGVMAQEVQSIMPKAVVRGDDGYLRVHYEKLGIRFQTYDEWFAAGARVPFRMQH